jgi:hypothetical protein
VPAFAGPRSDSAAKAAANSKGHKESCWLVALQEHLQRIIPALISTKAIAFWIVAPEAMRLIDVDGGRKRAVGQDVDAVRSGVY